MLTYRCPHCGKEHLIIFGNEQPPCLTQIMKEAEKVGINHLIAAAPDLLEALREAIRYVPYERWEGMTPDDEAKMEKTWKKIKVAMAKAEGKEVKG